MIMTYTDLYMRFKFGRINNSSMTMNIYQDQDLIESFSDVQDLVIFEHPIRMGCCLNINLSNKFINDTVLQDGKMVADKFIQLQEMRLGKIPVQDHILFKICNYRANDQLCNNTYWGFNGHVTISFAQANFIKWHLCQGNKFNF